MADTHVKGLAELNAILQSFPVKFEKNVLRGALRAGMSVAKEESKTQLATNGSVDTGILLAGLKVSVRVKSGTVTAKLKAGGPHGYLAHWIEFGTAAHTITSKAGGGMAFAGGVFRSIEHPGMQPKPFMRPALDAKQADIVVAVGEYIKARLDKAGANVADINIEAEDLEEDEE